MINPEEATLIINGWFESKSELLLSASMINFSVYARCFVAAINGDSITLWSLDEHEAVFAFRVNSPALSIEYSEMRELVGKPGFDAIPEDKWLKSALVISLSLGKIEPSRASSDADVERIILVES